MLRNRTAARRAVAVLLPVLAVTGCAQAPSPAETAAPAAGGSVTIKDCQGRDVTLPAVPKRVVTTDGWAAQAMGQLGLADRIVGTGFPGPITAVQEPLRSTLAGIPVLSEQVPVTEIVAAQKPDAVVTGFSTFGGAPGTPKDADLATMGAAGVAACGTSAMAVKPLTDLSATYDFLTKLGKIFRVSEKADAVIRDLRAREKAVADKAEAGTKLRVMALADSPVAGQPVKALGGGTIANALIEMAGGQNITADVGGMHADISPEEVARRNPQVIWVITDFSFAKTTGQALVDSVRANPLLTSTDAVKQGRILVTSQYLVGFPTPLNLDGLEQLAGGLQTTGS